MNKNKMITKKGIGEDGEFIWLEIKGTQFYIHAQNNTESPFEFEKLEDAEAFIDLLAKARMSNRIEKIMEEIIND
ncbi:hypothetical protein [Coleofasciculus sp.]|uniref:hypothetical protein n=1 Tax=Coleofasciculus sp. TaxID=3100458 RepID=UPI0039FA60F2